MKGELATLGIVASLLAAPAIAEGLSPNHLLGLPPVPVPADNPITPKKVELGEKLFGDVRFSSTGKVSCATCHEAAKAFTDSPRLVSRGIEGLTGTRNAPTVVNAAYLRSQFWDGREPDLEAQSMQPFLNPVEMGLESHEPILQVIRDDPDYQRLFEAAFGKTGEAVTIAEVAKAIASFERTLVAGDSPFDRYRFGGDKTAMSAAAIRGLDVFLDQGRCVSCHTISESHALFTDSRFHNINVSFDKISKGVDDLATSYLARKAEGADVDITVLTDESASELGRFAVSEQWRDIGSFKTPTLRNVALTAPYMHDGSVKTLAEVVRFYNNGGRHKAEDSLNDFQSGGIRSLDLSEDQQKDLVAFLEALTSPRFETADAKQ